MVPGTMVPSTHYGNVKLREYRSSYVYYRRRVVKLKFAKKKSKSDIVTRIQFFRE